MSTTMSTTDEKHLANTTIPSSEPPSFDHGKVEELESPNSSKLQRWANRLDAAARVEARGIERVPKEIRDRKVTIGDYVHMFTIWFAMNCTAN
jgi:hypothetical protein